MILANILWGAPQWAMPAAIFCGVGLLLIVWSYWRTRSGLLLGTAAGTLKLLGILALAVCLLEPLFHGQRPRPGANLFAVLADNSSSLQVVDQGTRRTRGDRFRRELDPEAGWQVRLEQDFEVRRYLFDSQLRAVEDFTQMLADGDATALQNALSTLAGRYRNRPLSGILLFTDGNATDWLTASKDNWAKFLLDMPPIYPVLPGTTEVGGDIRIERVVTSQSNFEQAPIAVRVDLTTQGYEGRKILVELLDERGESLQQEVITANSGAGMISHRFQVAPTEAGVQFYQVRAIAESEKSAWERASRSREATLVNNSRLVAVNRKQGPYRVLYVAGRPNWEYKFLRRAVEEDHEIELAGLIRIAKREPKFEFRDRGSQTANPLYRGAEDANREDAEQYDQPVIMRLGIRDPTELLDGFPKTSDALYRFDAIVLDDLEAEFFTRDQMTLIHDFVSRRGGGLLMLGGAESLAEGTYRRTPVGEMLPIYLDTTAAPVETSYRLSLTRDGWLQPWVRLRGTEVEEQTRLAGMPLFQTVNRTQRVKPGATVLAEVTDDRGEKLPALAAQQFGRGRVGALMVGDLWRWSLRRDEDHPDDMAKAWRQTIRWLVADVPRRVDLELERPAEDATSTVDLKVTVCDEHFLPMDNVTVDITVETPAKQSIALTAEPTMDQSGVYRVSFSPRESGIYRARTVVTNPDRSNLDQRQIGWATQPAVSELKSVDVNQLLLQELAKQTGGRVIDVADLDWFVADLPNRRSVVTEPWTYPIWHHWMVLSFALVCFIGEWGLRRWKGLA